MFIVKRRSTSWLYMISHILHLKKRRISVQFTGQQEWPLKVHTIGYCDREKLTILISLHVRMSNHLYEHTHIGISMYCTLYRIYAFLNYFGLSAHRK